MTEAPEPQRSKNHQIARTLGIVAGVIALNVYICRELFRVEYLSHMDSIEAAYIGISRYLLSHGLHLGWFPLWYGGIPFQNTYPPLLHALVAVGASGLRVSPARAHHIVTAMLYCLGPVTLYFLSARLSRSWRIGFASAVTYSLICPSAFLSYNVATFTPSHWDPARFNALVLFGDGPHVTSLTFLPLAILALDWALSKKSLLSWYVTAIACSAVVLTNWLGAFALALGIISYLLARASLKGFHLRPLLVTGGIAILAYAISAPWIPPSTIGRVMHNAQYVVGEYPMDRRHVGYALVLGSLAGLLFWILKRTRASLLTGFSSLFALFSCTLVLGAEKFGVSLMPQPFRYHLEMDLSLCLLGICLVAVALKSLPTRYRTIAVLAGVSLLFVFQAKHVRRAARSAVGPIDITKTIEYREGTWIQDHLPGKRIFLTGSTQFWLNAFADNPQVGGGFAQGIVNDEIPVVHYGIPWMISDGPGTVTWLKLFGVSAVGVSELNGRDAYRQAWRDPAKLHGLLPELFREGGDVLYGVPLRGDSLSHVIAAKDVVTRSPSNNVDFDPVRSLAAALDDTALPLADFRWDGSSSAVIQSNLQPGQLLFVQITYHPGWHAYVAGQERPIRRDGLGLMVVEPDCSGACEIRLVYDGGLEMYAAKFVSGLSLLFGVVCLVWTSVKGSKKGAAVGDAEREKVSLELPKTGRALLERISSQFSSQPVWRRIGLLSGVLFLANAFVCQKLFVTEYLIWWGSTDGPFISISRYAMDHYGDLSWFPLWFGGMPYHTVYCPFFPHLVAAVALATRASAASTFHALAAVFYCLGPVTLFWMAWWFSRSLTWSFLAGLLYSSVSPAAILFPIIRADVRGWYNLTRLYNVVIYGETPHVVALTLIPVAIIALDAALRQKRLAYYPLAAIALASVVLTSVTGTFGLAMAVLAYMATMPIRDWWLTFRPIHLVCIPILGYGLVLPWYPPSTVRSIVLNSEWSLGDHFPFTAWHLLFVCLLLAVMAALNHWLTRTGVSDSLRISALFFLITASITLPSFLVAKFALVPQPLRFRLELEMAVCLALAFLISMVRARAVILSIFVLFCIVELIHNRGRGGEIIQPSDVGHRIEYKEAAWFQDHMPGKRVFAPGSVSLWMNVWNDVPQMGGCCDQSVPDFEQRIAQYSIFIGENAGALDGEISTLWLQAYGAHAISVSSPGSSEYFLSYVNPKKFEGLLPVLWRDGPDTIYGVPQRSDSLAHVVGPSQIVMTAPAHGLDVGPLRTYVAALNDPQMPLAALQWTNAGAARINADLRAGDQISVQMSFAKGWRATVNGVQQRIVKDGLGMMVIDPQCTGSCTVELRYQDDMEMRVARAAQIFSICVCLFLWWRGAGFRAASQEV